MGTGAQISPVREVDGRVIGDGGIGAVTRALQDLYFDIVRGGNAGYRSWCAPVYPVAAQTSTGGLRRSWSEFAVPPPSSSPIRFRRPLIQPLLPSLPLVATQASEPAPHAPVDLEAQLAIQFANPALLRQALVHRSLINEADLAPTDSNERLEFLGDAVLGLVTTELLYERHPEYDEGELTRARASLVNLNAAARSPRLLGSAPICSWGVAPR